MAAQGSVEDSFTFIQGLVTEGGFFVHPKNAWKEGFNITPNVDGSVERRLGVDYEELYSLYAADIDASERDLWAFTTEQWNTVGGNGNLDFFVVQLGPIIHFYESATGTISNKKKAFTINLQDFTFAGFSGIVGTNVIKATAAYGKLIITCKDIEPILIVYEVSTDTITTRKLELLIRDFDGIRSPKADTTELTQTEWAALTPSFWPHALYNLYNQGWKDDQINKYRLANGGVAPDYVNGKLPSNSKQWIYGKDTNDEFDVNVLNKQDFGSMVAPKGRAILKAFYQDRADALKYMAGTNTTSTVTSTVPPTPSIIDFYISGR